MSRLVIILRLQHSRHCLYINSFVGCPEGIVFLIPCHAFTALGFCHAPTELVLTSGDSRTDLGSHADSLTPLTRTVSPLGFRCHARAGPTSETGDSDVGRTPQRQKEKRWMVGLLRLIRIFRAVVQGEGLGRMSFERSVQGDKGFDKLSTAAETGGPHRWSRSLFATSQT